MLAFKGLLYLLFLNNVALAKEKLKIAFWIEPVQTRIYDDIKSGLQELESFAFDVEIEDSVLVVESENSGNDSSSMLKFCEIVSTVGVAVVVDFTYNIWQEGLDFVESNHIPYLRVDRMISPFLRIFGEFIQQKGANDVALIFEDEQDKEEALYQMMEGFTFRTILLNGVSDPDFEQRLRDLRPSPSYYAVFSRGANMNVICKKLIGGKLLARPSEWHFIYLDTRDRTFKYKREAEFATKFTISATVLCKSLEMKTSYCQSGFSFQKAMILEILRSLAAIKEYNPKWLQPPVTDCNTDDAKGAPGFEILKEFKLSRFLSYSTRKEAIDFYPVPALSYDVNVTMSFYSMEHEAVTDLAVWENGTLRKINETITPAKRFFRIGVVEARPWNYLRNSGDDGKGPLVWDGYCIDLIVTLSKKMNFEYELIVPKTGMFGSRDPVTKRWDGIIGDLVSGETEFAVTALKMYAEREEVVDYIAPYFDQTGISIVIRKPVRQTSLFKFMTVLRIEVWLSIIAALVATAIMIWLLDKYSPYSATNNKEAYPYPCREFTLRESFWFALTSFTPQGGGEAPKAVSGRILVAAYWLFVVLMLATFTANLAAFLTVERMQAPVQSLEQLARQSRINYTVVDGSDTHHYFINMKFAEDTLYRLWKELALNASPDYHKFRIWDYPIKEQYGTILLTVNASEPVKDAAEGFRRVNEHENADFAFIHDSAEIKYELTHNCNLTEVGEVFAEQPYAIAVQQGSHLADEFSFAILELQKDRYFEDLKAKYWNRSKVKNCAMSDEQAGITLESLGGVFIATFVGLGLAMVTLGFEVLYYKKKNAKASKLTKVIEVKPAEEKSADGPWYVKSEEAVAHKTPPPTFEAATFRGHKVPASITLGGEEFKPRVRRVGLRSNLKVGEIPTDGLPSYVE